MCTSLTLESTNGLHALARTMDFAFVLDPDLTLIPRNYKWNSLYNIDEKYQKYAFAGLSKKMNGYVFADGVNEVGLTCAALYFYKYAEYHDEVVEGKVNLAPHEFVQWILSSFETLEEVKKEIDKVNFVATNIEFLGVTPPLHWIISDSTGKSIVIEPLGDIVVYDNPIGVMTNSPDFNWHMTNIRNYIAIRPHQVDKINLLGVDFEPFGQGSGTFGLPGDYTPPSRFIRTVFNKLAIKELEDETSLVNSVYHALSSVDIPKGAVITKDKVVDYTQHTACMVSETKTYYFKTYDNNQITKFSLLDEELDGADAVVFKIPKQQNFNHLNVTQ